MTKIIYPGTFDPITNGHVDIIERAERLFDVVIVAIAKQKKKNPKLSWDTRYDLVKQVCVKYGAKVEVRKFSGLLVDFAREIEVRTILRGVRSFSDFEYDFQMAGMNRSMLSDIETIFLTPAEKYNYLSASIVREIAELGGDISPFVPHLVALALKKSLV